MRVETGLLKDKAETDTCQGGCGIVGTTQGQSGKKFASGVPRKNKFKTRFSTSLGGISRGFQRQISGISADIYEQINRMSLLLVKKEG